jgi:hypothetical protein
LKKVSLYPGKMHKNNSDGKIYRVGICWYAHSTTTTPSPVSVVPPRSSSLNTGAF